MEVTGWLSAKSWLFICFHSVESSYIFTNSFSILRVSIKESLWAEISLDSQHVKCNACVFSGSETRLTSNLCNV